MTLRNITLIALLAASPAAFPICLTPGQAPEEAWYAPPGEPEKYRVMFKTEGRAVRCNIAFYCGSGLVQYGQRCVDAQGDEVDFIVGGQLSMNENRKVSGEVWTERGELTINHGTECGPSCLLGTVRYLGTESTFVGGIVRPTAVSYDDD